MDPSMFIRVENLYLMPVLRSRLAFAALFRRALNQLFQGQPPWDGREDLICVSLPPSLEGPILEGVEMLPRVSQVWAQAADNAGREIFAVTPSDAFVEAIRTARDKRLAIRFIDMEIMPGNILRHPCQREPDWADDSFVDLIGVREYTNLVASQLAQPPMRFEPVDTWREAYMSQRLRELYPCWRRTLFLCDMPLADPILASIRSKEGVRSAVPDAGRPVSHRVLQNLNLTVILNTLDDYPRLVERFYDQRSETGKNFKKNEALLDEIRDFLATTKDITLSSRQMDRFAILLTNHLQLRRRRIPDAFMLFQCAAGCFGRPFAERLHAQLVSYSNQVSVHRVRPRKPNVSSFEYKLDITSQQKAFETRQCNPSPPNYDIAPKVSPPPSQGDKHPNYSWPPEAVFLKKMQGKIISLGSTIEKQKAVRPYAGSVEGGIDTRRTLRAYNPQLRLPTLYVKQLVNRKSSIDLAHEPVLWILSDDFSSRYTVGSGHFKAEASWQAIAGRQPGRSFYISWHDFIRYPEDLLELERIRLAEDRDAGINVYGLRRLARITFGDQYDSEPEARDAYGERFERSVPNHQIYQHPEKYGCIHPDLVQLVQEGSPWVEVATLTAAKFASQALVVVAQAGFQLPAAVLSNPVCRGKEFAFVRLEEFSATNATSYAFVTRWRPRRSKTNTIGK